MLVCRSVWTVFLFNSLCLQRRNNVWLVKRILGKWWADPRPVLARYVSAVWDALCASSVTLLLYNYLPRVCVHNHSDMSRFAPPPSYSILAIFEKNDRLLVTPHGCAYHYGVITVANCEGSALTDICTMRITNVFDWLLALIVLCGVVGAVLIMIYDLMTQVCRHAHVTKSSALSTRLRLSKRSYPVKWYWNLTISIAHSISFSL